MTTSTYYRVDVKDDRSGAKLAQDVCFNTDMWHLGEEVLMLKLRLGTQEMAKRENRDKLHFRHPETDYVAHVRKVTRRVIVIEHSRTVAVRA